MEGIISWMTPVLLASLSFFLVRFFSRYDKFEEFTKIQLHEIDLKLVDLGNKYSYTLDRIQSTLSSSDHSRVIDEVTNLRRDLLALDRVVREKVFKSMDKLDHNFGNVVWLKDFEERNKVQDKKIYGLYAIIKEIVQKNKKEQP